MEFHRLVAVEDVPTDGTLVFTIAREGVTREVLLSRLADGRVVAWENHCQHWIDVRLDKGEGAVLRGDEIVCQNHGAMFDRETGRCTWGPVKARGSTRSPSNRPTASSSSTRSAGRSWVRASTKPPATAREADSTCNRPTARLARQSTPTSNGKDLTRPS